MKIKKSVDLDSLNEEEKEALESGEKTEEDLLAEYDKKEKEEKEKETEEAKKVEEVAKNQKIRAEKAEAEAKKAKDDLTPKKELSQTDLLTLVRADVADDDIQEVVDYATLKKITVKEALDSNVIKSMLAEKEEERKTAEATAIKQKRTGPTTPSGSDLLRQAESKGELPEDDEGMKKLVESRFSKKAANK